MGIKSNYKLQHTLAEQAHKKLEELIVTLELSPGSIWTEVELCEIIKIGRTPVHEAVQKLAADHLVTVMRRHGVMISNVNVEEQLLVLEARRELERLVAVKAARRISESERKELLALGQSVVTACEQGDVQLYLRRNTAVKNYIAEKSKNYFAANALAPLVVLSWRFYFIHHKEFDDLVKVGNLHFDVVKAVVAGDEQTAAAAVDAVMDYTEGFTRDVFLHG